MTQTGPNNPFWRGGRSVASNGYVLIRVSPDHHLADVRGYAYEHRIVAEQKIGRSLLTGEQVHHVDGNKQNNDPANLEVVFGDEHGVLHRSSHSAHVRMPGEDNPLIQCACECGSEFPRYDQYGRKRAYVSGHNPPDAPRATSILDALRDGPLHRTELSNRIGISVHTLAVALSKLGRNGLLERKGHGVWSLSDHRGNNNG